MNLISNLISNSRFEVSTSMVGMNSSAAGPQPGGWTIVMPSRALQSDAELFFASFKSVVISAVNEVCKCYTVSCHALSGSPPGLAYRCQVVQ